MATDLAGRSQAPGGQRVQFLEYDHFIERQLGRARAQIKSVEVLTSLAIFATGALAYLMVGALLDHWFWPGGFSAGVRWIAFAGFALAAIAYLAVALVVPMVPELLRLPWLARLSRVTGLPVLRRIHLYYAARTIERSQGTMKNSLVNFLDLRRGSLPPSVLHAVERQAASDLSRVEVEHAVNRDRLIRVLYLLLGVVVVTCLYTLFSPKSTFTAFGRMLFPGANIAAATRTRIEEVEPGDTTVFAGERVRITARVAGRVVPEELTLYYTTATRQVVEQAVPMSPASKGSRQYLVELPHDTLEGVQESFQYFLRGGDATTPVYSIRVIVPPTATVESVHYEYPAYTGLEAKTVPQADIAALEGTEVTVRARTNMGVSRARLDFGGDAANDLPMDVSAQELLVRFRLALDDKGKAPYDSYRIDFQTTEGQRNPRPTLHAIKVRPDLPPEVSLVHPGRDVELPSNGVLALVVDASDPDFALGGVKLRVREGSEAEAEAELIPLGEPPLGRALRATYTLDLAARGAKPGDVLHYWAEARDNKQPESNHAQTAVYTVRVTEPVSEEQRREMAEQAKQAEKAPQEANAPDQDESADQPTDQQQGAEKPAEQKQQESKPEDAATQPPKQPDAGESPEEQQTSDPDDKDVETLKRIMQRMNETPPEQPQAGEGQEQKQSNQQTGQSQSGSKGQEQQPGAEKQPGGSNSAQSKGREGAQDGAQGGRQQGTGDEQQSSDSNEPKGASGQSPSKQPGAPGEAPQPAPGEKQGTGAAKDGNPMGTGAQQSEGAPRDGQSPSEGSQPSGDKAGAESAEKQGDQSIQKSTTKPGPNEPGPNPNTAEKQPREDNPAGTAQPGRAGQRPDPQEDDNNPSTDKGSAPAPGQDNATSGQAMKKNPTPTSDNPARPLSSETKDPSRSPPDSDESNPPGNADPEREQHASKTKGGGSLPQFAGAGKEGEGQRGDAKGENQPGTNSAGQSGGAPSDEPGKSEDGTRPGDDTRSSSPGDQRGAGTKQPGNTQSGKGPSDGTAKSPGKPQPQEGAAAKDQAPDTSSSSPNKQPNADVPPDAPRDERNSPADSPNQGAKDKPSPDSPNTGGGQDQQSSDQPPRGGGARSGTPKGGQPAANAPPGGAAGGNPAAGQPGPAPDNTEPPPGEAPNLEYTRKAANLTLDQLDEQLRRNRVDQDLLNEQGWNQEDLKDFIERMRNKLDQRSSDPEKLRDVLDRLRRPVQASSRQAGEHQREVTDVVDRGPTQAPPELRDRVNAYVKRISERSSAAPKKNP